MNATTAQASSYLVALATSLLLAACGGGGSNEGEPQPPPGSLDPSFGNGGTVTTSKVSVAYSVALQPDGKVLVAGGEWLIRYDREGVLDASFRTGGFAGAAPGGVFSAVSTLLQPDNKIIASGSYIQAGGGRDYHCALVRYSSEGAIDRAFGDGGLVVWDPHGDVSSCAATAIGVNGSILVGIHLGTYAISGAVTARFLADGKLDTTFGADGIASVGGAAAIQPDGKILAVSPLYGHGLDQCTIAPVSTRAVRRTKPSATAGTSHGRGLSINRHLSAVLWHSNRTASLWY